ncbi:MAG: hypothetical protein ACYS30_25355 [Planctomycetota bacterium]|jgi:hypothetical protein
MNNDKINMKTSLSVIAIAQEESRLKAVELRKKAGAFEVLWTKSSKGTDADWRLFAAECGLSVELTAHADVDGNRIVVVGFNSAAVAFYRIGVPAVGKEETAAIVKLQAETQLPLPAEQMELAWRVGQMRNGQVAVTMSAARREHLQGFVENVRDFEPTKILLDCEGIIEAWRALFSAEEKDAVVVNMAARNTQVCLAEDGRLSNAVVLDIGTEDLAEQPETIERFVQDMRSVLDLFGYAEPAKLPVFVLSDGSAAYVGIVSSLRSAGLNARAALPDIKKLRAQTELQVEEAYEYCVPIGLALMALEGRTNELNIFERLYKPAKKEDKRHWLYSPKVTCAIASVMLVLLVVVSYAVDVASPGAIEKRMEASLSDSDIDMNMLMQRQQLIKTVAKQRPDLLDLLNQVVESILRRASG